MLEQVGEAQGLRAQRYRSQALRGGLSRRASRRDLFGSPSGLLFRGGVVVLG